MVKGLARFREHFRDRTDAFVVIGGVACDEWLGAQGLPFRPTKDIDRSRPPSVSTIGSASRPDTVPNRGPIHRRGPG